MQAHGSNRPVAAGKRDQDQLIREVVLEERFVVRILQQVLVGRVAGRLFPGFLQHRPHGNRRGFRRGRSRCSNPAAQQGIARGHPAARLAERGAQGRPRKHPDGSARSVGQPERHPSVFDHRKRHLARVRRPEGASNPGTPGNHDPPGIPFRYRLHDHGGVGACPGLRVVPGVDSFPCQAKLGSCDLGDGRKSRPLHQQELRAIGAGQDGGRGRGVENPGDHRKGIAIAIL